MCISPWKHVVPRINWSTVRLLLPTLWSCSPLVTLLPVLTLLMSSILSSPLLSPRLSSPLLSLAVCLAYDGPEAAMLSSPLNLLFPFSQGPDPAILSTPSLLESSFLFILASSSSHSPLFLLWPFSFVRLVKDTEAIHNACNYTTSVVPLSSSLSTQCLQYWYFGKFKFRTLMPLASCVLYQILISCLLISKKWKILCNFYPLLLKGKMFTTHLHSALYGVLLAQPLCLRLCLLRSLVERRMWNRDGEKYWLWKISMFVWTGPCSVQVAFIAKYWEKKGRKGLVDWYFAGMLQWKQFLGTWRDTENHNYSEKGYCAHGRKQWSRTLHFFFPCITLERSSHHIKLLL